MVPRRCASCRRRTGVRVPPTRGGSGAAAAGAGAALASAAASTSCLRMRPPTPVPVTGARSTPFWLASLRTSGVTYRTPLSAAAPGRRRAAAGAAPVPVLGLRGELPAWGLALGARPALRLGLRLGFRLRRLGARVPRRELRRLPEPITASSPPTSTVSSSRRVISSRVPATGDGISVSTLSVDTSSSGSSTSTVSPSS